LQTIVYLSLLPIVEFQSDLGSFSFRVRRCTKQGLFFCIYHIQRKLKKLNIYNRFRNKLFSPNFFYLKLEGLPSILQTIRHECILKCATC
jgi:hypothetical protein